MLNVLASAYMRIGLTADGRYVRTPEGAKKFGQAIGERIIRDPIERAKLGLPPIRLKTSGLATLPDDERKAEVLRRHAKIVAKAPKDNPNAPSIRLGPKPKKTTKPKTSGLAKLSDEERKTEIIKRHAKVVDKAEADDFEERRNAALARSKMTSDQQKTDKETRNAKAQAKFEAEIAKAQAKFEAEIAQREKGLPPRPEDTPTPKPEAKGKAALPQDAQDWLDNATVKQLLAVHRGGGNLPSGAFRNKDGEIRDEFTSEVADLLTAHAKKNQVPFDQVKKGDTVDIDGEIVRVTRVGSRGGVPYVTGQNEYTVTTTSPRATTVGLLSQAAPKKGKAAVTPSTSTATPSTPSKKSTAATPDVKGPKPSQVDKAEADDFEERRNAALARSKMTSDQQKTDKETRNAKAQAKFEAEIAKAQAKFEAEIAQREKGLPPRPEDTPTPKPEAKGKAALPQDAQDWLDNATVKQLLAVHRGGGNLPSGAFRNKDGEIRDEFTSEVADLLTAHAKKNQVPFDQVKKGDTVDIDGEIVRVTRVGSRGGVPYVTGQNEYTVTTTSPRATTVGLLSQAAPKKGKAAVTPSTSTATPSTPSKKSTAATPDVKGPKPSQASIAKFRGWTAGDIEDAIADHEAKLDKSSSENMKKWRRGQIAAARAALAEKDGATPSAKSVSDIKAGDETPYGTVVSVKGDQVEVKSIATLGIPGGTTTVPADKVREAIAKKAARPAETRKPKHHRSAAILPTGKRLSPANPSRSEYWEKGSVGYIVVNQRTGSKKVYLSSGDTGMNPGDTFPAFHDQTYASLGDYKVLGVIYGDPKKAPKGEFTDLTQSLPVSVFK
jgi:sorbitol-specific phosphotransferase system component IIA